VSDTDSAEDIDETFRPYSWFAIQTLSRHEKVVRSQLEMRNVEAFLPTTKRLSQWTDRKKEIEVPLFAGYCFARLSLADRLPVLQSQGVVRVIGSGGRPEPIPEEEIESLRKLISSSSDYASCPYLTEGMLVEVVRGPLQGVKGRLVREARPCRLILSISLIQRAVTVEIDADSVIAATNVEDSWARVR
jgi:transcription termination/antitermination protein NusG